VATATAKIFIGGIQLQPYHIQIEQRSDGHHRFEVTVSTEKAEVNEGDPKAAESLIIENAIAYAGEIAEITIERPSGTFNFKGYVTDVHIDQSYAGDAFIIFKGFSPTYLLDGRKSVAAYEEMSLADIFNDVLGSFPANVSKEVNPKYTKAIPYIVRYKETQYQFLSRLAACYGEWFYYDGQQLVFGDLPSKNPEVKLTFGSDSMLSFNYGINLRPSSFKEQFYKYQDNGTVEQSVASFEPGWLDAHSKVSLKASKDLFQEEGLHPIAQNISDQKHIQYLAEAKKEAILSDVMKFKGQSANPGITIGAEVEVNSQKGFIGKYRVIAVKHTFNANRDYVNVFQAIPSTSRTPPTNKGVVLPLAEPQVAEVVDNNDPDKLGRVRVKFKWQDGQTPWVWVLTNHAGKGGSEGVAGTYFTPEIGDEVFMEFEQGNPERPYVVGAKYHGGIPAEFADADNNLKAIKTRSGHTLVFDDTEGKELIIIKDKNGNSLKIDTMGDRITIKAGDSIVVEAGNSITLTAGKSISISAAETISLASTAINLSAGASVSVNALASYSLNTANKMENVTANTILRTKNLSHFVKDKLKSSAKKIENSASETISHKAKDEIIVSAKNKLNQRGGTIGFSTQKGKIKINAKSNVEIKGKQVKTN